MRQAAGSFMPPSPWSAAGQPCRPRLETRSERCLRIVGSRCTLAPGEAPEAVAQVQLAVLGAADHSPEGASRRANGLAFGGDHCNRGGRLVASHRLASVDPGRSADAELLTEPVGGFDDISPAGRTDFRENPGATAKQRQGELFAREKGVSRATGNILIKLRMLQ